MRASPIAIAALTALIAPSAMAQVTGHTVYNFKHLTAADKAVLGSTPPAFGKAALLFPDGRAPLVGGDAEAWLASGKPVRAMTFAGMPTTTRDSFAFAKEVAVLNASHARRELDKTPALKELLGRAERIPGIKGAAKRVDMTNGKLVDELREMARGDTRLLAAIDQLRHEVTAPVFTVRLGWGDAGTAMGGMWVSLFKRPFNETFRMPMAFDPFTSKVARLLDQRFAAGATRPIAMLGHSSGGVDAPDVAWKVAPRYRKHLRGYGLGVATNWPEGMGMVRQIVGHRDVLGWINSTTEALLEAKIEDVSHVMSTEHSRTFDGLPPHDIKPLAELYGERLFAGVRPRTTHQRIEGLRGKRTRQLQDARQLASWSSDHADKSRPLEQIMHVKETADAVLARARAKATSARIKLLEARQLAEDHTRRDDERIDQLREQARRHLGEARSQRDTAIAQRDGSIRGIARNRFTDNAHYSAWKLPRELNSLAKNFSFDGWIGRGQLSGEIMRDHAEIMIEGARSWQRRVLSAWGLKGHRAGSTQSRRAHRR